MNVVVAFAVLVKLNGLRYFGNERMSCHALCYGAFTRDIGDLVLVLARHLWALRDIDMAGAAAKYSVYDHFQSAVQFSPNMTNTNSIWHEHLPNRLSRAWHFIEDCLTIRKVELMRARLQDSPVGRRLPTELTEAVVRYCFDQWAYKIAQDKFFLNLYDPWPVDRRQCSRNCLAHPISPVSETCPQHAVWIWGREKADGERAFFHGHYSHLRTPRAIRCRYDANACPGHFTDINQWRLENS